jgi:hypothetical protein
MEKSSLLVYTQESNNRVDYAVRLILSSVLGIDAEITENREKSDSFPGPVINYSHSELPGALQIIPFGLLEETGLRIQNLPVSDWRGIPVFCTTEQSGEMPFDLFSASFYLATRYEEYLPFEPDHHGRFRAEDSLAYQSGFLRIPVINLWALELRKLIEKKFPEFTFPDLKYRYLPTVDVDTGMAYKYKGLFRTLGSLLRSVLLGRFTTIREHLTVITKAGKDPFDTYEDFEALHADHGLSARYFFALGNRGRFDKNLSFKNRSWRKHISRFSCRVKTGLHPSYPSWQSLKTIKKEKRRLERITRRKVTASRQHYLRMSLPWTYQILNQAGIRQDYSMGYATQPGFRAGICSPYRFYDLLREKEEKLMIWPFQVMDATLNNYMKLSPEKAIEVIADLVREVRKANGIFCSVWHNSSLSERDDWRGWKRVYEEMVRQASIS